MANARSLSYIKIEIQNEIILNKMSNTKDKADHPKIKQEFTSLKEICPFYLKDRHNTYNFLDNVEQDGSSFFYKNHNNERCNVSSLGKRLNEYGIRTLDCLYFKNGYGKYIPFKKHCKDKYNLNLS